MNQFKKWLTLFVLFFSLNLTVPEILPVLTAPVTVEAATPKLNKTKVSLVKGQKLTLKVLSCKENVKWHSSNAKVVSVTSTGKLTAKKKGTATITAKIGRKTLKCKVSVDAPVLSKTSLTLNSGKSYTLKLKGTKQKTIWKSSKTSVVKVNSKGKVTAKKAGTSFVSATVNGIRYKCKVTVKQPPQKTPSTPGQKPATPPSADSSAADDSAGNSSASTQIKYVYLPASGKKYHKIPNCGTMNPDKASKVSLKEAIERGYEACSKCF